MPIVACGAWRLGVGGAGRDVAVDGDCWAVSLFDFCGVAEGVGLGGAYFGMEIGDRFATVSFGFASVDVATADAVGVPAKLQSPL